MWWSQLILEEILVNLSIDWLTSRQFVIDAKTVVMKNSSGNVRVLSSPCQMHGGIYLVTADEHCTHCCRHCRSLIRQQQSAMQAALGWRRCRSRVSPSLISYHEFEFRWQIDRQKYVVLAPFWKWELGRDNVESVHSRPQLQNPKPKIQKMFLPKAKAPESPVANRSSSSKKSLSLSLPAENSDQMARWYRFTDLTESWAQ